MAALERLAGRLRRDPRFMSYVLAAYQSQENLTEEELSQELRTLPALVVRLALCKRPSPSSPQFAEQVREIAEYTLTDAARLANILRQVEALESLSRHTSLSLQAGDEEAESSRPLSGLLAAARDRVEAETDETPPPGEEAKPEE
jgi:hypothetical protein